MCIKHIYSYIHQYKGTEWVIVCYFDVLTRDFHSALLPPPPSLEPCTSLVWVNFSICKLNSVSHDIRQEELGLGVPFVLCLQLRRVRRTVRHLGLGETVFIFLS